MTDLLLVFLGGGLGAAARYWLSGAVYRVLPAVFPWGTLTVNMLGCFTIGLLMTGFFWVSEKNAARYMSHLQERASQLEKALGYRLWSAMPKAAYGFFRGAFIIPLVYASIALFWIYALISIR